MSGGAPGSHSAPTPRRGLARPPHAARIALAVAALALVAVLADAFVFNLHHWTLGSAGPVAAEASASQGVSDGTGGIPAGTPYAVYELEGIGDPDADTVAFSIHAPENAAPGETGHDRRRVHIELAITDSGQSRTPYTLLTTATSPSSTRAVLPVDAYGELKGARVTVWLDGGAAEAPVLSGFELGARVPFRFSAARAAAVFAVLGLALILRPGSRLWAREHALGPAVALAVCGVLVAALPFAFLWGLSDPQAQWGGPRSTQAADQYAMLARSLAQGRLDIDFPVDPALETLDGLDAGEARLTGDSNLYDASARAAVNATTPGYSIKHDTAFVGGRYYVYFGVAPVLMAYLPYHLLTGGDLSNTVATFPALMAFAVFSLLGISHAARHRFRGASSAAVIAAYLGLMCASMALLLASSPHFYNVPVAFALAFLAAGAYLLQLARTARGTGTRCALSAAGALPLAATLGCRPQVALGAVALGILHIALTVRARRSAAPAIACTVAPALAVLAALGWYNWARFGSPLDFGANYNLTTNDMTLRGTNLARALESAWWYLFGASDTFTLKFPLAVSGVPVSGVSVREVAESLSIGLVAGCPFILCALPLAGAGGVSRRTKTVVAAMLAGAALLAAFDGEAAGMLMRYEMDFGYLAGGAFAISLLAHDAALAGEASSNTASPRPRPAVYQVMLALLAIAVAVQVALYVEYADRFTYEAENMGPFVNEVTLQRTVDFWGPYFE